MISDMIRVAQNLGLRRVTLGPRPLALQLVGERVLILEALDVAARARITVPVPGTTDTRAGFEDAHREAALAELVQHVHAAETGADHDDVEFCVSQSFLAWSG